MKTIIKLIAPSHGWDFVELTYHTNRVGSDRLYTIDEAWQTYRGERTIQLNVDALLSFNPYEEIEEAIVAKTQGDHKDGLEQDNKNPRISFKINRKPKQKGIPE